MKDKYVSLMRFIIGILITLSILFIVDLNHFPNINQINGFYLIASIILAFIERFLNIYRWSILILSKRLEVNKIDIIRIYFKSLFMGLIMPSSLGGEFLKGFSLSRATSKNIDSFSSIIVERILGLLSLASICLVGIIFFERTMNISNMPALIFLKGLSEIILVTILVIILFGYFVYPIVSQKYFVKKGKILSFFMKIGISFWEYKEAKRKLIYALAISYVIQGIRILLFMTAGATLDILFDLSFYLMFVPIILLVGMIPFSPAGLGFQEGAFVYFFSFTGENPAKIFGMALLVRLIWILSIMPGFYIFVKDGVLSKKKVLKINIYN